MALTSDQVLQLLASNGVNGHAALTKWLATAKAESSLNPAVVNSIGAVGLFQILQPTHVRAHPEWTVAYLKDPGNNVAAARVLSNNWKNSAPWVSSTLGQAANTPSSSLEVTRFLQDPASRAVNDVVPVVAPVINAVTSPAQSAASAYNTITNPHNWLRLVYGLVGVALIYGAFISIEKGAIMRSDVGQAVIGTAKKVVTKGAA